MLMKLVDHFNGEQACDPMEQKNVNFSFRVLEKHRGVEVRLAVKVEHALGQWPTLPMQPQPLPPAHFPVFARHNPLGDPLHIRIIRALVGDYHR
jgi:hypothetical protein